MSPDDDTIISDPAATATSEVDIAVSPTNLCNIVAAANDATLGRQRVLFHKMGTWHQMVLSPPGSGDEIHRHPSVGWTSDGQRVWLINMVSLSSSSPFGPGTSKFLKSYFSDDAGETWSIDATLADVGGNLTIQSPRMSSSLTTQAYLNGLKDTIYVIWGSGNSVFVKSRNPQSGTWQDAPPLDSQSAPGSTVSGCDIRSLGDSVMAFWHDEGSGKILGSAAKTNDLLNGPTFGPTYHIADATASPNLDITACPINKAAISVSSAISAQGLNAVVVWPDFSPDGTKTRIWSQAVSELATPVGSKTMINDPNILQDQFHPRISYYAIPFGTFADGTYGQVDGTYVVVYYGTDPTRLQTNVLMQTLEESSHTPLSWNPPSTLTSMPSDENMPGFNHFQYGDYIGLSNGVQGFLFAAWTDRRSPFALPEQIWARRMRIPPIPDPCSSDPILHTATVTFNTTTDNKDDNTKLDVRLKSVYLWETIAYAPYTYDKSNADEFAEQSSRQVPLVISSNSLIPRSRLMKGRISITIAPQGLITGDGADTWKFNFILDCTFTNGESLHLQNPEANAPPPHDHIALSENNLNATYFITQLV
jgi:hypothetical protein